MDLVYNKRRKNQIQCGTDIGVVEVAEKSLNIEQCPKVILAKKIYEVLIPHYAKKSNIKFSKKELKKLTNYAVLKQICIFLENANNTKQTVDSFCKISIVDDAEVSHKYTLEPKKKNLYPTLVKEDEKQRILVNIEKLLDNQKMRIEQTINRNIPIGRSPNFEKHNNLEAKRNINKKHPYDFIFLCTADDLDKGFNLYNLLFLYAKPLEVASKSITPLKSFENGYKELLEFLNTFKSLSKKELVIKTLSFWKFEYSHKFIFALNVAHYMITNGYENVNELPKLLKNYLSLVKVGETEKEHEAYSIFIDKYDEIVKASFKVKADSSKYKKIKLKTEKAKEIIEQAILFFRLNYYDTANNSNFEAKEEEKPHNNIKSFDFTSNDFNDAAEFLINDFNLPEIIEKYNLNTIMKLEYSKKNMVFEKTKQLYLDGQILNSKLLVCVRNTLKSKRKERNSRPNKKAKQSTSR